MSKNNLVLSTVSGGIVVPDFNKKENGAVTIADEPRKLKITCFKKKNKTTGNLFNAVTGYVKLECFDENGKSEGIKVKGLQVHFRQGAFKDSLNVHNPDELKTGYLYVKAKGLQIPNAYKLKPKKDDDDNVMYDKDGNMLYSYPVIWVQSDVIGLEEAVTSQTALDVDDEDNVVDAEVVDEETGEVPMTEEDLKQYDYNDTDEDDETSIK